MSHCSANPPISINAEGWLEPVRRCPSPNHNPRPPGAAIRLLVIHNISLPPAQFGGGYVQQFFCNQLDAGAHPYFASIADMTVSAHCLIERSGALTQFVPFGLRAWHAGRSCYQGVAECNDFSVGIELEGTDDCPYTPAQYGCLSQVTKLLLRTYPQLTAEAIVGHSDIAPGRKTDPGPAFDWGGFRNLLAD